MITSKKLSRENEFPWYFHLTAVFVLDILLVYYLTPVKAVLCIGLAAALWWLAWEDYTKREVDIRVCAIFFILGLMVHQGSVLLHFYIGLLGFLIPHVIHEGMALIEKSDEDLGTMDYYNPTPDADIEKAPPYIPMFTGVLAVILGYYLLGLPISDYIMEIVFKPMPVSFVPLPFWILPLILLGLTLYFWMRNQKAMANGYNVIYRGFGDGDIYFIGAMIGILGFFLSLITVFFSLFIAGVMVHRWRKGGASK